jgi:hypothetical protein
MTIEISNIVRVGITNRINNVLPYQLKNGKFVLITNKNKKIFLEAVKVYWLTPDELDTFNLELKKVDEIQVLLKQKINLLREHIFTK